MTSVTETIVFRKYRLGAGHSNQEPIMSSLELYDATKQRTDLKRRDYDFILVLVCVVLAFLVASAIFAPLPVGSEISNQMLPVGP